MGPFLLLLTQRKKEKERVRETRRSVKAAAIQKDVKMSAQGKPVCSSDLLLQLQEEIKKGNGGNDYSRFLERKIAELELKEEALHERRIAELELKEEEGRKPHPNPATVARLERRVAELNLMKDKGALRTAAPMPLTASSGLMN